MWVSGTKHSLHQRLNWSQAWEQMPCPLSNLAGSLFSSFYPGTGLSIHKPYFTFSFFLDSNGTSQIPRHFSQPHDSTPANRTKEAWEECAISRPRPHAIATVSALVAWERWVQHPGSTWWSCQSSGMGVTPSLNDCSPLCNLNVPILAGDGSQCIDFANYTWSTT